MSGSVALLKNHRKLISDWPRKSGPMRIEMATACRSDRVAEFPEPISTIFGRSNSDRSNYKGTSRKEDFHLSILWLRLALTKPKNLVPLSRFALQFVFLKLSQRLRLAPQSREEWRVRKILDQA